MSVLSVFIALQASGRRQGATAKEFLLPLDVQPGEAEFVRADGGAWQAGLVCFAVVRLSDFAHVNTVEDAGAPTEAFFARVREALLAAGKFLARRSPEVTAKMRTDGLSLRLFIDLHMDDDQMELELPPELLAACGQHQLGVYLISNDPA